MELSIKVMASGVLLMLVGLFTCVANDEKSEAVGLVGKLGFISGTFTALIGAVWWIWTQ